MTPAGLLAMPRVGTMTNLETIALKSQTSVGLDRVLEHLAEQGALSCTFSRTIVGMQGRIWDILRECSFGCKGRISTALLCFLSLRSYCRISLAPEFWSFAPIFLPKNCWPSLFFTVWYAETKCCHQAKSNQRLTHPTTAILNIRVHITTPFRTITATNIILIPSVEQD